MSLEDFRAVVDVHLIGSANCTKAVWETMREQAYGRILMTSSSTGLYGNFGQANYGAAKLGLAGLAKTLALEGAKYNVRVNTIAPVAATRMTEELFPPDLLALFKPELVAPAALFLVSEDAPTNAIVGAGAGVVQSALCHPDPRNRSCPRTSARPRRWRPAGTESSTATARSCRSPPPTRRWRSCSGCRPADRLTG